MTRAQYRPEPKRSYVATVEISSPVGSQRLTTEPVIARGEGAARRRIDEEISKIAPGATWRYLTIEGGDPID